MAGALPRVLGQRLDALATELARVGGNGEPGEPGRCRGSGTALELTHAAVDDPEHWQTYGPGAVGVGWDLALLGLTWHLQDRPSGDRDAWGESPEARRFMTASSRAWGAAYEAAGASPAAAAAGVASTTSFYAPDPG